MTTYDPAAYREFFERDFTYLTGFRRNAHPYANQVALLDPATGTSWTYAELSSRVDRLAAGLAGAGVRPGDAVAYQLYNGPEFAHLYLATQACGAVGAPFNFRLAAGETAFVLDDSRPKVFVYETELGDIVRSALERSEHRPDLVVAAGEGEPLSGIGNSTVVRFEELLEDGAEPPALSRGVYEETTRLYTSGTTGMPKGVPLNSMVEIFSAHDVIMHFPLVPEDRTLNMTPWFHRGGLYSGGPNPVFYVGGGVVPMRAFDPELCLDYVERFGLTYLIGAPTNLEILARAQAEQSRDLSTLRGIVTMGAPLERVEVFEDRLASPEEQVAKDGAEIGEVIVRSPKSGYAYFNSPEQEAQKFHNGWVYLGDLATWDADEFVTIVGRKDDMLVSGGENVHPIQVEEALNEHPGVMDSLVVGVSDEKWGQLVVAYVIRADESLTALDCEEHCRQHPMLAPYKRPRAYRFVDEFPRTATGKKIHYQATQQAAEEYAQGLFEAARATHARG
jgi:acyl-CoA synthetase (AMP-forming)/AMP-acid ligase II